MSLQEAASSGSFNPQARQPTDPQPPDAAAAAPRVDIAVDQAAAKTASPFGVPYDVPPRADDALGGDSEPDMRAARRRAWAVVGLAVVIPAAVAGLIAWQLFGTNAEPAPVVTRVTTTPAETVAQPVSSATTASGGAALAATDGAETPTTAAVVTSTSESSTTSSANGSETTTAAAAAAESDVDLASLDPAARLAAWPDLETIEVLEGESLWLIAQNYNTTISAIATVNGITDPASLSVGQQLVIPVGFTAEIVETAPALAAAGEAEADAGGAVLTAAADGSAASNDLASWHTIAPVAIEEGDSLEAIAVANGTSVGAIMALNGLSDANLIFVGTELLVPVGYQGDLPIPEALDVAAQPVQQVSTDTSTAETAAAATEAPASSGDDLLEEEIIGADAGGEDDDLMLEE